MRYAPALLVVSLVALPADVAAQEPQETSLLDRVERLAHAGRADEARVHLTDWWEETRPTASGDERERAIWLRGLLTVDPEQASLDFWRLVVEHPGGPHTAAALERIGLAAEASGDGEGAARTWGRLVTEYGGTPEADRARQRLAPRAAGMDAALPVGTPADPAAGAEADTAPPPPDPASARAGDYAVQLGAFGSVERARELMQRVREAGFEPRLVRVPGSDLARVRLGRFMADADAETLRRRVAAQGFEALVTDGAGRETPVGGGS